MVFHGLGSLIIATTFGIRSCTVCRTSPPTHTHTQGWGCGCGGGHSDKRAIVGVILKYFVRESELRVDWTLWVFFGTTVVAAAAVEETGYYAHETPTGTR